MPEANLDELMREMAWVRRLARSLVHDETAADDIAHDAYLAAQDRLPDDERPLRPWLHRVVLNVVRMRHRSNSRRSTRELATATDDRVPTADELVERMETQRALADAVLALAEPFRSTVLLHYVEGLSSADIARELGIPAATVRQRLKTALDQLRARLRERDRRNWMVALIPLARGPAAGAVAMKKGIVVVLSLLVLLLVGGGVVYKLAHKPGSTSSSTSRAAALVPMSSLTTAIGGTPVQLPAWIAERGVKGRRLAGRVVFAGQPVPNASVRLGINLGNSRAIAPINTPGPAFTSVGERVTNARGEFDFGIVPAASYVVSGYADDKAPVSVGVAVADPKIDTEHVMLVLGECRTRVVGTVRDTASPVARARLVIAGLAGTESDAKGHFTLCMPATRYPNLRVEADGYGSINVQVPAVAGELHRDFVLVPEATISGVVVDEQGAAVEGAAIDAWPMQGDARDEASTRQTLSGPQGHFELTKLAPAKFAIRALDEGGHSDETVVVTSAGASTHEVRIVIEHLAVITGHVVMKGQPIAGARVGVSKGAYARFSPYAAESQPDGAFTLNQVPRGKNTLDVFPYEVVSPKTIDVDGPPVDVTIEVSALASLKGRVTRHGSPVPNAQLEVRPINANGLADAEGNYEILGLPAGQYLVDATDYKAFVDTQTHLEAGEQKHFDLELESGGEIKGMVVDQHGTPEVGVVVSFVSDDQNDQCSSLTDSRGAFTCATLTGKHDYTASVTSSTGGIGNGVQQPHPFKPVGSYPRLHVDNGDSAIQNIQIAIEDDQLSLRGRVVDDTGAPIADARITSGGLEWGDSHRTRTDEAGAFVLDRLAPGTYDVRARTSDGGVGVTQAKAGAMDVAITIARAGSIQGTLVGFSSTTSLRIAAGMETFAERDEHEATLSGMAFSITGLRPGTYVVQAARSGTPVDIASVEVKPGTVATVTLKDQPHATVSGRVVDLASGAGVAGLACRGMPSISGRTGPLPSNQTAQGLTDASGTFSVDVPVGRARIECLTMNVGDHSDAGAELDAVRGANHVDLKSVRADPPTSALALQFDPTVVPPLVAVADPTTGLRANDTITSVDGLDVHNTVAGFVGMLLMNHHAGSAAEVGILRDGKPMTVKLTP
ncbi:MAG TPA: sigma-70 family RNA polymerase sigma factor [Kofleriaceae bacterium]